MNLLSRTRRGHLPRLHPGHYHRFITLLVLLLAAVMPGLAAAHLSIIRQGPESAGLPEAGDRFGAAVATGDFNGDGYDDLATGAPAENVGLTANVGSVTISWGSEFGLTHVGAVYITASSLGGTSLADADFGYALASADFNHDGYDDLVIGAPGETVSGQADAGRIYLLKGSASGLTLHNSYTESIVGDAAETADRWGQALAVGNFNGDAASLMDLAVGAPGEDNGKGMVGQLLGSPLFFLSGTTFRIADFGLTPGSFERFGFALAAGNLFGDSRDDLAVGIPSHPEVSNPGVGAVLLLRGASSGLVTTTFGFITADDHDSVELGGSFGGALCAGRFFGGSFDALAVGEPGRTSQGHSGAGRIVIFRGGSAGLGASSVITQSSIGQSAAQAEQFGTHLAAGTFGDDASTYEDLAIGWNHEAGNPVGTDAGAVAVVYGGANGPGNHSWAYFDQGALNDYRSAGDELGASVAFGRFDATNKDGLAVGAPGEASDTGQVHIIAPWRQRFGLTCRYAVVTDCAGQLVFTLRPFDRVYIASTTKAMTTLLAAERTALPASDPKHISMNADYEVPFWVADQIPGSQVPLNGEETMNLHDLMWTCLFMSGNDAAFAIADLCEGSGGPTTSVVAFVDAMNAKAASLGMTGTHFHNPAGLDNEPVGPELGEHYSTPYDMMLLGRAAMNNPIVAGIVGSTDFSMTRRFAGGAEYEYDFHNIFSGVLQNDIQVMTGIKGGQTGLAQVTGLFAANAPGRGTTIVTTFLTDPETGHYTQDAAHLAELGLASCDYSISSTDPPYANAYLGEFDTCLGCQRIDALELNWGPHGDRMFLMARTGGAGVLHTRLDLEHRAEMLLDVGQSIPLGISPFKGHGTVVLRNLGTSSQIIQVTPSAGGSAASYTIPAQGYITLPPWTSPTQLSSYTMTLTKTSTAGSTADIQVEIPYIVEATLNPPSLFTDGNVTVLLKRNAALLADAATVSVTGLDPGAGGRLTVVVKEPGATSGVADGPAAGDGGLEAPAAHVMAGPNPTAGAIRVSFDLRRAGEVTAELYDLQGRLVRRLLPGRLEAGAQGFTWDGRSKDGSDAPAGIYFLRLAVDGAPVARLKIVRTE